MQLLTLKSGREKFEMQPVDFAMLLRNSEDFFQSLAQEKKVNLKLNLTSQRVSVSGIENSLRQLTLELISNAIRVTPSGKRVKVELKGQSHNAIFTVQDQGPGIPPAFMKYIFHEFCQVENQRDMLHGERGGLGLALAKAIVELHKGTIKFQTQQNHGTKFIVVLPKE